MYRGEIREMFAMGSRVSTDKLGPAAMLEKLKSMYPGRYSLPGENEIRQEITRIFGNQKNLGTPATRLMMTSRALGGY